MAGEAEAVTVTGVPTNAEALFAGADNDTVVETAEATLTLTTTEVATAPFESVARAVSATTPTDDGDQLTE